ncbi:MULTISPECIES: hypothetical protein [Geobacillus]|jgi:DNA-binding PadR family transcriptional regulator|uniref:hypothetical protein n=1 Tax=Geobacillus TaxID=129337 RepID=UPI00040FB013|nr:MULTISPECIES: hypothetical protein [Geobacillus]ARA96760.1 hypothetical protein GD3902_01115 [Geobacillus thermodenitrificans]MEC5186563.1 DNA-binding PadR family transcriptional regulator [Geobacillus thermodenitrificans]NNU88188.1 hypothetical protein [Geobacillus sp. MR]PJW20680.1 hypothetical protein CV632_09145 [Geobacillus thermodenitrificans]
MVWVIKAKHESEDGKTTALELESEDGWLDANVRWDGCMEIHLYSVTEEGREWSDTFRTCDLQGLIEQLQSLDALCQSFFESQDNWGEDKGRTDDGADDLIDR